MQDLRFRRASNRAGSICDSAQVPALGRLVAALVRGETSCVGEHTGLVVDLAVFSRNRPRNAASTNTVMG